MKEYADSLKENIRRADLHERLTRMEIKKIECLLES